VRVVVTSLNAKFTGAGASSFPISKEDSQALMSAWYVVDMEEEFVVGLSMNKEMVINLILVDKPLHN
jgi:hypothetical protein